MNRFITKKFGELDYVTDRLYLSITLILLLLIVGIGIYQVGFSNEPLYYKKCDSINGCNNEYYNSFGCLKSVYSDTPLCTQKTLAYGEVIGKKPPFIVSNINFLVILIVGGFLVLNTWKYNKHVIDSLKKHKLE